MEESANSLRILIADDDSFVLSSFLDFLDLLGHETLPARDGIEAIELFEQHRQSLDLLITDICMPGMDGLGLIQHVRKHNEKLPIIVVTGYADSVTLNDISHLDIPVLTKPLNFTELKQHLC